MNGSATPVVGRFAPTPSGRMHLGNVFSCLIAWLGARSADGKIILRIEDLDPRAAKHENAELLMGDLDWLGFDWDEGPLYQSERSEVYADAVERLCATGLTYPCFCTRQELHAASAPHASDGSYLYQGTCRTLSAEQVAARLRERPAALRLRVPSDDAAEDIVVFEDAIVGDRRESLARECGDFLVRRSDGVYAYQLAVVVDDATMGVTQVVRGCDLLGSVARQIYLQHLLGFDEPTYAHVPLLVAHDGRRLSKRDRDLDLGVLRESGVSQRSIIGALAASAGLIEEYRPCSADELLEGFAWKKLSSQQQTIEADDVLAMLSHERRV